MSSAWCFIISFLAAESKHPVAFLQFSSEEFWRMIIVIQVCSWLMVVSSCIKKNSYHVWEFRWITLGWGKRDFKWILFYKLQSSLGLLFPNVVDSSSLSLLTTSESVINNPLALHICSGILGWKKTDSMFHLPCSEWNNLCLFVSHEL